MFEVEEREDLVPFDEEWEAQLAARVTFSEVEESQVAEMMDEDSDDEENDGADMDEVDEEDDEVSWRLHAPTLKSGCHSLIHSFID